MYKIQTNFFGGDTTFIDDFTEVNTLDEAIDYVMNNKPPDEHEWDVREDGKGSPIVFTRYSGREVMIYRDGKVVTLREKDQMDNIPFNIWDDYYDDGFVPQGEIQETHGYIEEYDILTKEQKAAIIKVIYDYIINFDMKEVEVSSIDNAIYFKHLTHENRHRLLATLVGSKLKFNGIPIMFYSES